MELAHPPRNDRFRMQLKERLTERFAYLFFALCIPLLVAALVIGIFALVKPEELGNAFPIGSIVGMIIGMFLTPLLMTIFEAICKASNCTLHLHFQGSRRDFTRLTLLSRACVGLTLWLLLVGGAAALPSLAASASRFDPDFETLQSFALTPGKLLLFFLLVFLLLTIGGLCANWFIAHRKSMSVLWLVFVVAQFGTLYKLPDADGEKVSILFITGRKIAASLPEPVLLPLLAVLLIVGLAIETLTLQRINLAD